ncbi:MAG: FAD/NAD(P)-binding protein [Desulfuromonadia bacterium]
MTPARSPFIPFPCEIVSIQELTPRDRLFRLLPLDGRPLGHEAGQFVQVSIPGFEEAPISIASPPSDDPHFELGIRRVGRLTTKLHSLFPGDRVGIRGPYGKGFDTELFSGGDLLLIAGGCGLAPLRSLIETCRRDRGRFGSITLLYGAANEREILFADDFPRWEWGGIACSRTVDHDDGGTCRDLRIGFVTTLVEETAIDPEKTWVAMVGPPIMYPPAIAILARKGVPSSRIFLSLERQMRCGVGTCGHCAIEHLFCCIDGPVFRLDRIEHLRGAL